MTFEREREIPIPPNRLFNETKAGIFECPVCHREFEFIHKDYSERKKKYGHSIMEIKKID